jgi:flagellar M-ring protein FliF
MKPLEEFFSRTLAAIRKFREGNRQLFNAIVASLAMAFAICGALYVIDPGAPQILVANLNPADRTAIALRLRRHNLDFTLGADSIAVPAYEFNQAHLVLQASPGFSGGGEDFRLFDRSTMGQSDFDEQVNYQRSLQGEIERTIMDIRGVDSARVMLAMGRPSPFALGPSEAERASVMVTAAPGATLDSAMAAAIARLVANSVRGLDLNSVTVTDNDGAVIFPTQNHDGELGDAMRLRNEFEHRLEGKVSSLLNRIMGDNRYAVQVAVDIDTSRVSSTDKLYGKGDQAVLSEEHSQTPVSGLEGGGVPGLTSNLPIAAPNPTPGAAPTASDEAATTKPATTKVASQVQSGDLSRKDIVNYKPSIRETNTVTAPVRIKRISVAAVLDGTYESGRFKPLDKERLDSIKELVAAAVGAEQERGDSVDIQSAALSQPYVPPVPDPLTQLRSLMANPLHFYGAIGVGLLALIVLAWMVKRSIGRKRGKRKEMKVASAAATAVSAAAPAAGQPPVEPADQPKPEPAQAPEQKAYQEIRKRINEEVERNPEAAANIVRKWLAENSGTTNGASNGNGASSDSAAAA